ncbi:MAG: energy-coupling factor transporter ATPase [Clostridiales bacterium]|jgi:energy-coupling factor transport system ATP-binding protein|nr:energy-coupling factor transporter ATPase [Clostridiales bacterium]
MIEVKNAGYTYEGAARPALSDISLTVRRGEMLAVVGHNGSGKSTLAKLLNGLLLPQSGDVLVDGMNTKEERLILKIRQRVGMVFQNPDNQLVTTVVEEDVAFGPESIGVPPPDIRKRVDAALAMVNMQKYADRAPHMLSGGQKQRVAIAGMLAMQPEVLVMDEATAMLDPEGGADILEIMRRLNRTEGITVVMITQQMEEAALCDRMVVLFQGTLLADDAPRKIFRDEAMLVCAGLNVPAMVRLRNALNSKGAALLKEPINVEELASAIAARAKARHTQ